MAYTNSWDEAAPDGNTTAAADLDLVIQNVKKDVRERLTTLLGIPDFLADPIAGAILNLKGSATSKIVPGATSLSVRDNTDTNDNLLVANNGDVTVRGILKQGATAVSLSDHEHDTDELIGGTFAEDLPLTFPSNISATKQVSTPIYDAGNSGTTLTLDFDNGVKQKITLTGNCTFDFDNLVVGAVYQLLLIQDATGSRTATWPAEIDWGTNGTPVLTTTASKMDVITLLVYSGSKVLGFVGGYSYTPA